MIQSAMNRIMWVHQERSIVACDVSRLDYCAVEPFAHNARRSNRFAMDEARNREQTEEIKHGYSRGTHPHAANVTVKARALH